MTDQQLDRLEKAIDLFEKIVDRVKAFCPTGPGGGVDPTCSPGQSGGFKGKPANPDGKDTMSQYQKPDGSWTPERAALHDKIVKDVLSKATPVKNGKAVGVLMGGGPASGKSHAINSGNVKLDKNVVHIDSDEIKKSIPEYGQMSKAGDPKAAAFAHEESSYLAKRILDEAGKGNYNTVLDGTGNGSMKGLKEKVDYMRGAGQRVSAKYVTVDTEVAVARNTERFKKTGRLVPESFVRYSHASVSNLVPQAIKEGLFDDFDLYDTNGGEIMHVASAKGKSLTVHNQAAWDKFIQKGSDQ